MTKLLWKNEYDANAVDYAKPEKIANWYNNGSLEKVVWSSDEVKSLFVTSSPPKPTGVGEPADTPSSGRNGVVGAIAGGVFGGLVELFLICVGVWWVLRRWKLSNNKQHQGQTNSQKPF